MSKDDVPTHNPNHYKADPAAQQKKAGDEADAAAAGEAGTQRKDSDTEHPADT